MIRFYPTLRGLLAVLHRLEPADAGRPSSASPTTGGCSPTRCSGRCSATPSSICSSARRSACCSSFVIAYYLDRVRFMHGFIRALYFLPFLTTAVAMAWVWRWFYQPVPIGADQRRPVAARLAAAAVPALDHQALPAVLAPAIWAGLGFQIVIFMAGLRAIPATYYEAARIDGVGELDDPARDHAAAAQADDRLPGRVLLDRLPADLRPGLQHDRPTIPAGRSTHQAAGADDLPDAPSRPSTWAMRRRRRWCCSSSCSSSRSLQLCVLRDR